MEAWLPLVLAFASFLLPWTSTDDYKCCVYPVICRGSVDKTLSAAALLPASP
eukprot:m.138074 g.138074  ORF g.138074 m.138074 type:complete len:52 (-) comp15908_c1_seq3:320-475(-)